MCSSDLKIKSSSGSLRLRNSQEDVARFASELLRIKAQIMCRFYSPQILLEMSGASQLQPQDQPLIPQALELLKNEVERGFRIDVEADSMVMLDEQQEKQGRMEFLTATGSFVQKAMPVVAQAPELADLAVEMLRFGVNGFRVGKSMAGVFDQAAERIKQSVAQKMANPQPSPDILKAQADMQMKQAELSAQGQADQVKMQHEMALEQFKAEQEIRVEQFRQQAQQAQFEAQKSIEMAANRDAENHQIGRAHV